MSGVGSPDPKQANLRYVKARRVGGGVFLLKRLHRGSKARRHSSSQKGNCRGRGKKRWTVGISVIHRRRREEARRRGGTLSRRSQRRSEKAVDRNIKKKWQIKRLVGLLLCVGKKGTEGAVRLHADQNQKEKTEIQINLVPGPTER